MIAPAKIPLIQSAIALSTVSKGRHLPLEEMVDKGLEHIQQEDNVGENFHSVRPFFYNKVRWEPFRNHPGHLFFDAACRGGADAGMIGDTVICIFYTRPDAKK